ncbi:Clavaminate synthase-like protein [Trametes polyzona]|nr:Clavaminate synthase-like protein [Trametes polyzona]
MRAGARAARSCLALPPTRPCVRRPLLRYLATSAGANATSDEFPLLKTRPVPDAPPELASSPQAFLDYLRSPSAAPLLFRGPQTQTDNQTQSRAEALLSTLRAAGDRLVEVEVGRYDKVGESGRVEVPLRVYLDWLAASEGGAGERMQLYLAQWRARDEVPGLADVVKTPELLAPLLESQAVDLYQTSFFVGPSTTVTPLHYDPYFNLYNVYASSDPDMHAKHFVLLPPTLSEYLSRGDGSVLRNTSPVDLHLRRDPASAPDASYEVAIDPRTAPLRTREAMEYTGAALSCVLREGDTLFVPRRWWHRVENVRLRETSTTALGADGPRGWTAGVGWWFLPRNS